MSICVSTLSIDQRCLYRISQLHTCFQHVKQPLIRHILIIHQRQYSLHRPTEVPSWYCNFSVPDHASVNVSQKQQSERWIISAVKRRQVHLTTATHSTTWWYINVSLLECLFSCFDCQKVPRIITTVASRWHASSIDCFFCRKDRFSLTVSCCNAPLLSDFTKLFNAQCTPSVVRASAVDVLAAGLDTRGVNVCLGRVASSSLGPDRDTTCGCAVDLHRATCSAILLQN